MTVNDALQVYSNFYDYPFFEIADDLRTRNKTDFIEGKIEIPNYTYPKLIEVAEGKNVKIIEEKNRIQAALNALADSKIEDEKQKIKAKLVREHLQNHLAQIELVEAAAIMHTSKDATQRQSAQKQFEACNQLLYRKLDEALWLGIINTEVNKLNRLEATDTGLLECIAYLKEVFNGVPGTYSEVSLQDDELYDYYGTLITERYANVLSAVPHNDSTKRYGSEEVQKIFEQALQLGGFEGWRVTVDPSKQNVDTNADNKLISLTTDVNATSSQTKRLMLHELEVHARRGKNGAQHSYLSLLGFGTANYAAAEEGLGLFLEMVIDPRVVSPAVERARNRYITAGLALGTSITPARDARETYEILWRLLAVASKFSEGSISAAKDGAYKYVENAFRGTDFATPGAAYTKLKIYFEGLLKNIEYMRQIIGNTSAFEQVFIGKYDHTDPNEVQAVQAIVLP